MIDEIPCTCGHLEKVHLKHGGITNQPDIMCTDCFRVPFSKNKRINHWHYFTLDNLSYIEQVARAKGLI